MKYLFFVYSAFEYEAETTQYKFLPICLAWNRKFTVNTWVLKKYSLQQITQIRTVHFFFISTNLLKMFCRKFIADLFMAEYHYRFHSQEFHKL